MFSALRQGRRRVLALASVLALLGSWPPPGAQAKSGTSVEPAVTWGTATAADGRAQPVLALAVAGGRVFLGGEFTAMVPPGAGAAAAGTVARHHLAALDVQTHRLLPWNPDADGPVRVMALASDRTKLYVGGDFQHIGGTPASFLARLDLKTVIGPVDGARRTHAMSARRCRSLPPSTRRSPPHAARRPPAPAL